MKEKLKSKFNMKIRTSNLEAKGKWKICTKNKKIKESLMKNLEVMNVKH